MPHSALTLGALVVSLVVVSPAIVPAWASQAQAEQAPHDVATRVKARTGAVPRVTGTVQPNIPAGVVLDDGLTPDEAVAIALWNNAAFQVSVSQLGFARADLLDAGVLTNPVLSLLFPIGPKQLEATLRWPVEVLWERPRRVAAARLASDAAAERLVQAGLDLVAAVRIAYADLSLATDVERLANEGAALLTRIDVLTQSRLAAGDIGELEARAARVDMARGEHDAARTAHDIVIARERLRLLLGLTSDSTDWTALMLVSPVAPPVECSPATDLLREALVARPDVRAAELGVEAAAARLGWERSRILALTAVLDANGAGRDGFELGPGFDIGLPIFNRNQGGRARAGAELQRASAAYAAVQQQVAFELREASALTAQAQQSLATWRGRVVTPLEANVTDAERAFTEGETSRLFVLEHSWRLTEAQLRERELVADEQRARARIERAVGRSCATPSREVSRER
jgi:cobalt-zinc-cadmium efflux system outer membrane protein